MDVYLVKCLDIKSVFSYVKNELRNEKKCSDEQNIGSELSINYNEIREAKSENVPSELDSKKSTELLKSRQPQSKNLNFQCKIYDRVFERKRLFKRHLPKFHTIQILKYESEMPIKQAETSKGKTMVSCTVCHKEFSSRMTKAIHEAAVHNIKYANLKLHVCPLCTSVYHNRTLLQKHLRKCSGRKKRGLV